MKKILFICHGNICRSPMAEMVFKHIVNQNGKEKEFFVDSAATDFDAIGCGIHRGTRNVLVRNQISFTEHYAKRVTMNDYIDFDLLICMDDENLNHLERIIGKDSENKVHKLLEYCGESRDVADPWYTGNFDETFDDILKGCKSLFQLLNSEK